MNFYKRVLHKVGLSMMIGLCFSSMTYTQMNNRNFFDEHTFHVGGFYTFTLSHRILTNTSNTADSDLLIDGRNDQEIASVGKGFGLGMYYRLSRKLNFHTGVSFVERRYQTKWAQPIIILPVVARVKTETNFRYFDIPIQFDYAFYQDETFKWYAGLGIVASFLASYTQSQITEVENANPLIEKLITPSMAESTYVSPYLSAAFEYKMTDKASLRIEPNIQIGITKSIAGKPIGEYIYGTGVQMGFWVQLF